MPRALASLILAVAVGLPAAAQSSVDQFRFRSGALPVGTVYHYVKTNFDGSHPEDIALYVAAADRIEAFKRSPSGSGGTLVVATMAWSTFSPEKLESWRVSAEGRQHVAVLSYDHDARVAQAEIFPLDARETVEIRHVPFHMYDFDFASLNVTFRYLVDPEGAFTIGIADPTYSDTPPFLAYQGEVRVEFQGVEERGGVRCRKYGIDGAGLKHRGGSIWVDAQHHHIVEFAIDLADEPGREGGRLRLQRTEQLDLPGWTRLVDN